MKIFCQHFVYILIKLNQINLIELKDKKMRMKICLDCQQRKVTTRQKETLDNIFSHFHNKFIKRTV